MPTCTVNGCFSTTGRRFPTDVKLREKWLESLNRSDQKYTPNSVICLKHFCESDFVPDSENIDSQGRKRKRKRLKPTAVPRLDFNDPLVVMDDSETINEYSMDSSSVINKSINPWSVSDASVFLKYCCPECDYIDNNLSEFSNHALESHVLSNTLFNSQSNIENEDVIKWEQEKYIKSELRPDDDSDYPMIDVKEEHIIVYDDGKLMKSF